MLVINQLSLKDKFEKVTEINLFIIIYLNTKKNSVNHSKLET